MPESDDRESILTKIKQIKTLSEEIGALYAQHGDPLPLIHERHAVEVEVLRLLYLGSGK